MIAFLKLLAFSAWVGVALWAFLSYDARRDGDEERWS